MDLSAVIFVVLALAWAVYLIPKALQHHDEVAAEQLDEPVEDRARVLSRRVASTATAPVPAAGASGAQASDASGSEGEELAPAAPRPSRLARLRRTARAPRPELTTAGRAARNRRRVLAGLLGVLALVWVLTWFAYLPAITPLWPSLAVVGWLVLARVSVVRMQRAPRRRPVAAAPAVPIAPIAATAPAAPTAPVETTVTAEVAEPVVVPEAPVHAATPVVAPAADPVTAQVSVPVADPADALWDPLPLTLPTYVGKATARRTVRTIELTGVTSSGHDAGDTALAREATGADSDQQTDQGQEQRRVAGA